MKNLLIIISIITSAMSHFYIQNGTVVETYDNVTVIETADGNLWEVEDVTIQEDVTLVMYDNNTDNITDDIIINF